MLVKETMGGNRGVLSVGDWYPPWHHKGCLPLISGQSAGSFDPILLYENMLVNKAKYIAFEWPFNPLLCPEEIFFLLTFCLFPSSSSHSSGLHKHTNTCTHHLGMRHSVRLPHNTELIVRTMVDDVSSTLELKRLTDAGFFLANWNLSVDFLHHSFIISSFHVHARCWTWGFLWIIVTSAKCAASCAVLEEKQESVPANQNVGLDGSDVVLRLGVQLERMSCLRRVFMDVWMCLLK